MDAPRPGSRVLRRRSEGASRMQDAKDGHCSPGRGGSPRAPVARPPWARRCPEAGESLPRVDKRSVDVVGFAPASLPSAAAPSASRKADAGVEIHERMRIERGADESFDHPQFAGSLSPRTLSRHVGQFTPSTGPLGGPPPPVPAEGAIIFREYSYLSNWRLGSVLAPPVLGWWLLAVPVPGSTTPRRAGLTARRNRAPFIKGEGVASRSVEWRATLGGGTAEGPGRPRRACPNGSNGSQQ